MVFNSTYGFFIVISSCSFYFFSFFTKKCLFRLNFENFNELKSPKIAKASKLIDTALQTHLLIVDSKHTCYLLNLMDFTFIRFDVESSLLQFKETHVSVNISEAEIGGLDASLTSICRHSKIINKVYLIVNSNSNFSRTLRTEK